MKKYEYVSVHVGKIVGAKSEEHSQIINEFYIRKSQKIILRDMSSINQRLFEKSRKVSPAKEENKGAVVDEAVPVEETEIFKELKAYRLSKSREENIKPYFIYNDSQLKDLILKMPKSKEELKSVAGFGEVKANKYSDDILNIVGKFC